MLFVFNKRIHCCAVFLDPAEVLLTFPRESRSNIGLLEIVPALQNFLQRVILPYQLLIDTR